MDVIKCEAVLAAVDTGSLTAAAEQLGYTQSGITRMINSLETELGFSVFSRSKKGVELTENGRMMLPHFRNIVLAQKSAAQLSADIRGTIRGTITIGSYYSIAAMILPGVLKEFRSRYPEVSVRLQEGGNLEMSKWLSEHSVDLCFGAKPALEEVQWIPLIRDELVVWLPKEHPLSGKKTFPVGQLEKEAFIHTAPDRDTDQDRFIAEKHLKMNTCFTTEDGFTTYNMVAAGLGISFNQTLISKKWSGAVAELPLQPPAYIELGLSVPSGVQTAPAAKKLIECLKEMVPGINDAGCGT